MPPNQLSTVLISSNGNINLLKVQRYWAAKIHGYLKIFLSVILRKRIYNHQQCIHSPFPSVSVNLHFYVTTYIDCICLSVSLPALACYSAEDCRSPQVSYDDTLLLFRKILGKGVNRLLIVMETLFFISSSEITVKMSVNRPVSAWL